MPVKGEEVARSLFDAFNRRDLEATLSLLHPDIVFQPVSGVVLNDGEPYRGHDGIRRYFAHLSEHWYELRVDPVHIRAAGNAVVALGQTNGQGRAGPLVDAPTTWIFKFKDGHVLGVQVFADEDLARQALATDEDRQLGQPAG